MALKLSNGLRNFLLSGGSFKEALDDGKIILYTGAAPGIANDAATGTKIVEVTNGGSGITLDAASGGTISKTPSESWSGTNIASGTVGYWRWVASDDDGTLSTDAIRLQGTCGLAGADMNMSSVNLVSGAPQIIDAANFTMPASA